MDRPLFEELLQDCFCRNGLSHFLKPQIIDQLYRLLGLLTEANSRLNLTAIRDEKAVIPLHFADCLLAAEWIPEGAELLDCGCGGGFPSLPLAIARPDLHITALDSTAKKLRFVADAAEQLGLTNLKVVCARAEELAKQPEYRERFDVCTARAVAALPVLTELCVGFIRVGGRFVALKGAKGEQELRDAAHALQTLGCEDITCHALTLQTFSDQEVRTVITASKIKHTPPGYPRIYAQILKKPL